MAAVEKRYRILGAGVSLRADRREYLEPFDRDYRSFAAPTDEELGAPAVRLEFRDRRDGSIGIFRDGVFVEDAGPADPPFLYPIIRREIFRKLTGYLFFHGGVVARGGKALIISGPPGAGKSTLVLALAKSGFTFFSDELCPVDLETGLIHPFPRTLWVAPKTGRKSRKVAVPLPGPGPAQVEKTAAARCLVILDPVSIETVPTELKLHARREAIEELARSLEADRTGIKHHPGSAYGEISIPFEESPENRRKLIQKAIESKELILDAALSPAGKADFSPPPQMERIPSSTAAKLWFGHLIDRSHPLLIEKPGAALVRAARLLRAAACYRLVPGDLSRTISLVESAWAESGAI